nr:glycosyltransferase family 1 protein [Deinococcus yavapaiensis]
MPQLTGASCLAGRSKLPGVVLVHDVGVIDFADDRKDLGAVGTFLVRQHFHALRFADRIVVCSEFTRDRIVTRLPALRERIHVIPNGVSSVFLESEIDRAASRSALGAMVPDLKASHVLLYVGTETKRKNVAQLLRVLRLVKSVIPDVQLLKVGSAGTAEHRGRTLRTMGELGLEPETDVVFLDSISDELLMHSYAAADAYVSTSLYEGFGLPLLEALAMGAPVITLESGPMRELLGKHGDVVANSDEAIADSVLRALKTTPSPEAVSARRQHARQFTWKRSADQYLHLFQGMGRA